MFSTGNVMYLSVAVASVMFLLQSGAQSTHGAEGRGFGLSVWNGVMRVVNHNR